MSGQISSSGFRDSLKAGDSFDLGRFALSRGEIVDFATRFDPFPFHLDDATADHPVFRKLSASGWHAVVMMHRHMADFIRARGIEPVAGLGADGIRWIKPLYVDEPVTVTAEVVTARPSASRPGKGVLTLRLSLVDEGGELVATMTGSGLFELGTSAG